MRLTVGPLPPAVYWRRRAILLAAVLLVLFLVAQACMSASARPDSEAADDPARSAASPPDTPPSTAPSSTAPASAGPASAGPEQPDGGATPAPSATPDPADQPAAAAADPASDPDACSNQEMLITARTDDESFPAGDSVQFTIVIQNGSDRSCVRDIGGDHRELYLRKGTGANKVWSSQDCGGPSGSDVRRLPEGFGTSYYIVWHGRSSETCSGDEPAGERVEPGDYQLVARLGTAYSDPVGITVTG